MLNRAKQEYAINARGSEERSQNSAKRKSKSRKIQK